MLGPLEAAVDGVPADLGQPKQRALLAQLLLARGRVVGREALVDALWGERPPASAAAALQVYVHGLRRALGSESIETRGTGYRVALTPGQLDLDRFDELVDRGARALRAGSADAAADDLRAALALRRGPVLADLPPGAETAAAVVERQLVEAFELLVEAELAAGRHDAVLAELELAVAAHPYRERLRAHHALALYRAGRSAEALEAIGRARAALDELGLEPAPELRDLERAILRHDEGLRGAPARATPRLPRPPTPLVGRAAELRALAGLLETSRLVTVTGPGGIGKTRLAIAAAEQFADGAAFVDLSPLDDPGRIGAAIAEALGAAEESDPARLLAGRSLLLVLDNLEQVVEGAPAIADVLAAAPGVRVLATSRVPLRLAGERELALEPLPTPPRALPTFAELAANDSVVLFVERARAIDAEFDVSTATLARIAEISRAVDGVPLALELAAARTRVLSLDEIVSRLGRALDLLATGGRDRPVRHRTLRATLDWSHQLLGDRERRTFAALAVFSGGFTLEAVEAVAADGDALDDLTALVEASLVRRGAGEGHRRRLRMLETVRAYAGERLAESGVEGDVRLRHARHFLAQAQDVARRVEALDGDDTVLDQLDADHDNFRAALATLAQRESTTYVELVLALQRFWLVRGHLVEARGHIDRALELELEPAVRAAVLVRGAIVPSRQGDTARAKALWEEALALFEQLGDADGTARCVAELAGVALYEGDVDAAAAGYSRARELFVALGQRFRVGIVLANLAEIHCIRGDLGAALAYGEEAVALQRELHDLDGIGVSSINLARIHLQLGDAGEAQLRLAEGFAAAQRLEYLEIVAYGLVVGAELAWHAGDAPRAARLLGGVDATFAAVGAELLGLDREGYERTRAAVEDALGEAFAAACAAGGALDVDVLVELALA